MLARGELQTIGATTTRRVPQARREGRRPRAPLPAGQGRRADAGPHDRDPEGRPRQVRGAPPGHDHRPGDRRRGQPRRPLHLRPPPARQGDRPHRRGRQPPAHQAHGHPARSQEIERKLTEVQEAKKRAVEEQQFEEAGRLRDQEKSLLEEKAAKETRGQGRRRRPVRRGRRGSHRRGAQHLDRHPGLQAHRGGDRASCSTWRTSCTSGSSARRTPSRPSARASAAPVPA